MPRGLAIKVVGVTGERLPDAAGETQDFVLVNGPVFQAKTSKKFLTSLKMLAMTTDRLEGTKKVLPDVLQGVNTALQIVGVSSTTVQSMGGAPNLDPLGETYYSVTPIRYGDHIAKFSLRPICQDLNQLKGKEIDTKDQPDAIRQTVQGEMSHLTGEWKFCVQLCRDLTEQPIEAPTVEWDEEKFPFIQVATLHAKPQDSWSDATAQKIDEEMRFSVWTGLAAHKPLDNINRARKATYEHSARFRENFTRCRSTSPFREDCAALVGAVFRWHNHQINPEDFNNYNARVFQPGGFYRGKSAHEREWKTPEKRLCSPPQLN